MGHACPMRVVLVALCLAAAGCGGSDCGDNDNTPGGGVPTPTATSTAPPQIPCPQMVTYLVNPAGSDFDVGFSGLYFDQKPGDGGSLTFAAACPGSFLGTCGTCQLSGPIASTTIVDNRRCQNATETTCTSDADCPGSSCAFFFGAPLPISGGGVPVCISNRVSGNVTGTVSPELGSGASDFDLVVTIFNGLEIDRPCPTCNGTTVGTTGVCQGGARDGASCTVHGTVEFFGNTSFDCPPNPSAAIGSTLAPFDLTTGTRTLEASQTCTTANQPCYCPGQPLNNNCDDAVCTVGSDGDGLCQGGPMDGRCDLDSFRSCTLDTDCPRSGDSCGTRTRPCLGPTDASGAATGPIVRTGTPSQTQPLQVSTFCIEATTAPAINLASGLPGPAAIRLSTSTCIKATCP